MRACLWQLLDTLCVSLALFILCKIQNEWKSFHAHSKAFSAFFPPATTLKQEDDKPIHLELISFRRFPSWPESLLFYVSADGGGYAEGFMWRRVTIRVSFSVPPTPVSVSQTSRYSDGDLTLIYSGGEKCSSGFQRMSVINFECNKTAGERWRHVLARGRDGSTCVLGNRVRTDQADVLLWTWPPLVPRLGCSVGVGRSAPSTRPTRDTHILFPSSSALCLFWEGAQPWACWESISFSNSGSHQSVCRSAGWVSPPPSRGGH